MCQDFGLKVGDDHLVVDGVDEDLLEGALCVDPAGNRVQMNGPRSADCFGAGVGGQVGADLPA